MRRGPPSRRLELAQFRKLVEEFGAGEPTAAAADTLESMRRAPKILQRLRSRIKHGVQRADAQYEALRRHPPPPTPILRAPLGEITLPTDRLEQAFRARRAEETGAAPTVPFSHPERDPAAAFARRQWAKIAAGDTEDAARVAVEAEVAAARRASAADARALAQGDVEWPAASEAARAAFEAAARETPYDEWPDERKRDFDAWLMGPGVLGWDWETERDADEHLARLDLGADPEDAFLGAEVARLRSAALRLEDGDAEPFVIYGKDDRDDEDRAFVEAHAALAARAEARPLSAWSDDEVAELDAFLEGATVHASDAVDFADPALRKRLEAFPELDEAYHAAPPPADDDGAAVPAPKPFATKTLADPLDVAKALAQRGLYPQLEEEEVVGVLKDGIEKASNAHMVESVVAELTSPDSYSRRRVAAAKRAHAEQGFLDRIAKPEADVVKSS